MKFEYKYSKGQTVFYGTEKLTIKKRNGNGDSPAYWVEENGFVYSEKALSPAPQSESGIPVESNIEEKKMLYKRFLQNTDNEINVLSKYARNLNLLALRDELAPTYGRETEINKIKSILLRRTKPNPLLTGVAGCGKTAIVEELARTFVNDYLQEENPHIPIIYDLSLNSLISGCRYRGDFEERLAEILKVLTLNKNLIIFIDEIHGLNEIGNAEGATSAGQILKPALARGDIRCIGATTTEEYKKYIATDKALSRRFSLVQVNQLVGETRTKCITNIIKEYGEYFAIDTKEIETNEIENIVDNIMTDTIFPDNVVDIIDSTLATAKFEKKEKITMQDIKTTVTKLTGYLII